MSTVGPNVVYANLWLMITPLEDQLLPRSRPIVVPIDGQNIAVMGGKDKNHESMDDVIFFNIKHNKCRKEL